MPSATTWGQQILSPSKCHSVFLIIVFIICYNCGKVYTRKKIILVVGGKCFPILEKKSSLSNHLSYCQRHTTNIYLRIRCLFLSFLSGIFILQLYLISKVSSTDINMLNQSSSHHWNLLNFLGSLRGKQIDQRKKTLKLILKPLMKCTTVQRINVNFVFLPYLCFALQTKPQWHFWALLCRCLVVTICIHFGQKCQDAIQKKTPGWTTESWQ